MDYQKLRKWLRFYEKEDVSAEEAILLIAFYVRNLTACSFVGVDADFEGSLCPVSSTVCKDDAK